MAKYNQKKTKLDLNKNGILVYGFGSSSKQIIDQLLNKKIKILFIIDQKKYGNKYKGIPIYNLQYLKKSYDREITCLIALHNHYVDMKKIVIQLKSLGFKNILSLINLIKIYKDISLDNLYWLDNKYNETSLKKKVAKTKELMSDKISQNLLDDIVKYRSSGIIEDYPDPSLHDEYSPDNLPKFKNPLNIVDCGACKGEAIKKFIKYKFSLRNIYAFEPDISNYKKLVQVTQNYNSINFPLGVWSSNSQFRFNSNNSMASSLSKKGDSLIQCVRLDETLSTKEINLIKYDVEGAEIEALKGSKEIINSLKPNLCISIYHIADHLIKIPALINSWNLGYKFYLRVHEHNTFGIVLYCINRKLCI